MGLFGRIFLVKLISFDNLQIFNLPGYLELHLTCFGFFSPPFDVWHTQINALCKLCGREMNTRLLLLRTTECYLYIVYVLQEVAYIHSKGTQ